MVKKKTDEVTEQSLEPVVTTIKEPTDLEVIEAEMREISPTLKGLKNNNPARYKEAYRRFMWLVGERDRLVKP